jgi:predicted TIM-barrel fold metal-dependent hydrolase
MDRYGVETSFVMSPPSSTALKRNYDLDDFSVAARRYPGRFRFMGGGGKLNPMLHGHSDPSSVTAEVRDAFATEAHRLIRAGALGFGEMSSLHVSLSEKHRFAFVPADHPLLLLLADIAAELNVPIDLHCDALLAEKATPQSLARFPNNPKRMPATIPALERLLAHNPKARIIWDHAGTDHLGDFTPARIGAMLDRYPNLFLSLKIAGMRSSSENKVLSRKSLDSAWRDLLIRHADRFVIGTDSFYGGPGAAGVIAGFTKLTEPHQRTTQLLLSKLPPGVARQIGWENAHRLYGF